MQGTRIRQYSARVDQASRLSEYRYGQRAVGSPCRQRCAQRWKRPLALTSPKCVYTLVRRLRRWERSLTRGALTFTSLPANTIRTRFRDKSYWDTSCGMWSNKDRGASKIHSAVV